MWRTSLSSSMQRLWWRSWILPNRVSLFPPSRSRAYIHTMSSKLSPGLSRIVQSRPLGDDEAKWVSLRAVEWIDPSGKHRQWESADRRTRKGDTDGM